MRELKDLKSDKRIGKDLAILMPQQTPQSIKQFGRKGWKKSSAQPETVSLSRWEEAVGVLESVSRSYNGLRIVIRIGSKSIALVIPENRLVGMVPNYGRTVAILGTEKDFRIKAHRRDTPLNRPK